LKPLAFADFTWDPTRRLLSRHGAPVRLGARAADILALLLLHRDRLVSKAEILDQVWPAATVEENNLTVQVSALRKLLGRGVITTVAGRGYRWAAPVSAAPASGATPQEAALSRKPAISVLPFEVRPARVSSAERAERVQSAEDAALAEGADYLGDGLARDVAAGLSRSPWLVVIAHDSAQSFRGTGLALGEIASRLGAQYLVRGTVSRRAGRLRVTADLLFGPTGEILMAETFERPAGDLFELEDLVVRRIVGAIEPRFLQAEELRARWRRPDDVSQWDLLMRARWHFARASQRHNLAGQRLLQQALVRHPDDATALALLAFGKATEVWSGWARDPQALSQEANRLALRAVALDDRDAWSHFVLGVASQGLGLLDRAIASHRRALALHPHFAGAAGELGRMLVFRGDTEEGAAMIRQAIAWSPTEPHLSLWMFGLATAQFIERRYAEAARLAQQGIDARPDWFFNHYLRAASLCLDGRMTEAQAAYAEARRLLPSFDRRAMSMGHPFADPAHRDRYAAALGRLGWPG